MMKFNSVYTGRITIQLNLTAVSGWSSGEARHELHVRMLISNKNKAAAAAGFAAVNDRSVMTEWIHPTEVERMDVMDVFSTAYIYIYTYTYHVRSVAIWTATTE